MKWMFECFLPTTFDYSEHPFSSMQSNEVLFFIISISLYTKGIVGTTFEPTRRSTMYSDSYNETTFSILSQYGSSNINFSTSCLICFQNELVLCPIITYKQFLQINHFFQKVFKSIIIVGKICSPSRTMSPPYNFLIYASTQAWL